jgi:hypothetical protein
MIEALSARREARLGSAGQGREGKGRMIYSQELLAVAKRVFWFGTPRKRSNSHCGFSPMRWHLLHNQHGSNGIGERRSKRYFVRYHVWLLGLRPLARIWQRFPEI